MRTNTKSSPEKPWTVKKKVRLSPDDLKMVESIPSIGSWKPEDLGGDEESLDFRQ